ncbi:MAG: DUF2231 domain-containing protein [Kofleriaceae bacterium]
MGWRCQAAGRMDGITMPLHPKLVHLPIALAVIMPLLSLGLLLMWIRGVLPRRTWFIALGLQAMLVGSAYLALRTGEDDEERVEAVVPEAALEAHEEAAEVFLGGAVVALALVGAAAGLRREGAARIVAGGAVVATLVVLGLGYRVGEAGGALVYRHGAGSVFATGGGAGAGPGAGPATTTRGDDDDD